MAEIPPVMTAIINGATILTTKARDKDKKIAKEMNEDFMFLE
jgi:hypothetical protein